MKNEHGPDCPICQLIEKRDSKEGKTIKAIGTQCITERMDECEVGEIDGIILPEGAKERRSRGITWRVVAVGSQVESVKADDVVILDDVVGEVFEYQGKKHRVVNEDQILAMVE